MYAFVQMDQYQCQGILCKWINTSAKDAISITDVAADEITDSNFILSIETTSIYPMNTPVEHIL